MQNTIESFGMRIRALRESKKLSREALAEQAEISVQFLFDIETGKKSMTISTLKRICTALNSNADYIVFGRITPPSERIAMLLETLPPNKQDEVASLMEKLVQILQPTEE